MDKVSEPAVERPSSQAELSVEISRLVSRILSGDDVDTTLSGAELAIRYPDAGMSGEMIAQAIVRAAGMVGMIRDGAAADAPGATADGEGGAPSDGEASAALSAELEELIECQAANGNGAAHPPVIEEPLAAAPDSAVPEMRFAAVARGAMVAVRRAFFRG